MDVNWSGPLRNQLRARAEEWAHTCALPAYKSLGTSPTLLFEAVADSSRHGNFHDKAWAAILATPDWRVRLDKAHAQVLALPEAKRVGAKELDSSNSSDALLMNCFCFPDAAAHILKGLALPPQVGSPQFGFRAEVPLKDGTLDRTEVDLKLGDLIFEAKLTESDFTSRPKAHVFRYREVLNVFDVNLLPSTSTEFHGYQLIRNVLAAEHHGATLVVLLDQRRPDLLQEWWAVHAAIKPASLRVRCGFRTWQQVRAAAPDTLGAFLETKYGL
jgi:hypothetical protein